MTDVLRRRYDAVDYPTAPVPSSAPDHLAVLARLCGLRPAPVATARVLELGCGDGANLLPHAAQRPGANFEGIDLAAAAVCRGRAEIEALQLSNIQLHAGDYAAANRGRFDYVLAVGVLSWVPESGADALLAAVARHLDDGGIATVSFNCWPGWQPHHALREALLAHGPDSTDPTELLAAARRYLAEHPPFEDARARLEAGGDAYLLHEYLAPHNRAYWLDEVVAMAARHGLHFLGTAALADLAHPGHEQQRATALGRAADAVVLARQPRSNPLAAEVVAGLHMTARLHLTDEGFHSPAGVVATPHQPTMRALERLAQANPIALGVAELAGGDATVLDDLTLLAFAGACELRTGPVPVTNTVGATPTASPLVRRQAARQGWATSAWHHKLLLRDDQRELLAGLDGTGSPEAWSKQLGRDVMPTLQTFAQHGLLIA